MGIDDNNHDKLVNGIDGKANESGDSIGQDKQNTNASDSQSQSDTREDEVFNDSDADFTLVSSDRANFKIHRHLITTHSRVLRDMMESGMSNDNRLEFNDRDIETSDTIRLLLRFLYHQLPSPGREMVGDFRNLIEFAQKYDCGSVLLGMKGFIWSFLNENEKICDPLDIFIFGAQMNDPQIAAAAITRTGTWTWGRTDDKRERWYNETERKMFGKQGNLTALTGGGVMQVACWPMVEFCRVPMPYWLALLKTDQRHSLKPHQQTYAAAAEYFLHLMKGQ
ncbi:hypothetical protein IAT40_001795 [Kwoniella sp. CBS 6097]